MSKAAQEKVASYMPIAEKEGATIAAGGRIPTDGALGKGFFHEPTVLVDVKPNMRVAQEEIFGPVTSVIEVSSIDEAIKVLNNTKYGLSSSVYTRNVNNAFRFMRDAETGIVYVNAGHDRRRDPASVRRHEGHRQRAPRGRSRRARRLFGVEVDLRRLLGQAPARADGRRGEQGALAGPSWRQEA